MNKIIRFTLVPILIFLLALLIYYTGIFNKLLFPNPFNIFIALPKTIASSDFSHNFPITFYRIFASIIISTLIGIPLGVLLGYFERIYLMFEFLIDFFRSIPAPAMYPIFMLFFGVGDLAKIFLSVYLAVLFILVNTSTGVRNSNKSHYKMAKVYRTSKKYLFLDIIFIGAIPYMLAGIRMGISIILLAIIVAEMFIGSVSGLGHAILNAQLEYDIPKMYALIILTGAFGYVLNKILLIIEKKVIHWN